MAGGPRPGVLTPGDAGRAATGNPLHDYLLRDRGIAWAEVAPEIAVPLRFTDPVVEHAATRRTAGLFDFSFMASFDVAGPDAASFVERVQTRPAQRMGAGTIAYTLLLREDGTVLNDATLWRRENGDYTLFTGRRSDGTHLRGCAAGFDVTLEDASAKRATCAVQGPLALRVLEAAFPQGSWGTLPYFHFRSVDFEGAACDIARLGYTGEAGFEAVVDAAAAPRLWQRLASVGAPLGLCECGFEAADLLRIEAGLLLFATELARPATPLELGLERLLDPGRARFLGARALRESGRSPPAVRLAGLTIERRATRPTHGAFPPAADPVRGGHALLTSEGFSPLYRRPIGLGFVAHGDRWPGTSVRLQTGDVARVARLPFYDPPKLRPRRGWNAPPG